MYVNKHFEKITGFTRADVLGKNCRFLQCADSEAESIAKFSNALKQGESCQVVLTNKTLDGKIFKNLVSLKPVYDDQKRYLYVMAIHIDVSREVDECVAKMRLASDLIEMLPDLIITDDPDKGCLPHVDDK